jgi:hypothetical protein
VKRTDYRGLPGVSSRHQRLLLTGLVALVMSGQAAQRNARFGRILPDSLGDFNSVSRAKISAIPVDFELLNEYGLRIADHLAYVNSEGRRMVSEAFQFGSSEGAHAAFLYLRPVGAVASPLSEYSSVAGLFGQTSAALAGGVTVVARNNYVFRFRNSAPSSIELRAMLDRLPGLDPTKPSSGECCRYFVESSERILLGPVSLAKFAARVPPGAAGFRLGVRGRVARFEAPSGAMTKIVFEYASRAVADERFHALRALNGARAKIVNRRVAVIFDAANVGEADELLADIGADIAAEQTPMSFDPISMTDGPMTLDDAMASTFLAWGLGCLIAVIRFLTGIPDHTIALNIAQGES